MRVRGKDQAVTCDETLTVYWHHGGTILHFVIDTNEAVCHLPVQRVCIVGVLRLIHSCF